MIGDRHFVAHVWCPVCQTKYGEIHEEVFREQDGTHYRSITNPVSLPKYCPSCDAVIERKPGRD